MLIQPINNFILVEVQPVKRKTDSGIILTGKSVDREQAAKDTGKVVAMSPDAFPKDMFYVRPEVGDTIIFSKYAGVIAEGDIESEQPYFKLMPDTEVYGIIKEEAND